MKENFIQLPKSENILTLKIRTDKGELTGESLTFDLQDIEIPLKYQEILETIKKNNINLRNELLVIDKREDVKGKKLLSKNEEDKVKALQEYYKKQIDTYNNFLGENGVQKLLNGRKVSWTTLQEVDEIIEKQIAPYLNQNMENIVENIKKKYGDFSIKKDEQIEVIK